MTLSYTKNLHLAVPDFLSEPWHAEFAAAMDSIDQIIFQSIVLAGAEHWVNNHLYIVGDIVIDPDTGGLFVAAVDHTSAASGTFAADRAANPGNWTPLAVVLATKAEAEAGVENTKYMSPLRTKQAIDFQRPPQGIASQIEAEVGTENTHMMTPLRTAQAISVRTSGVPQGRLTLLFETPVLNIDVLATTTVYYTQYTGQSLPIYNGSRFETTDFWDSLVGYSNDNAKAPAIIGANEVDDWFIWKDSMEVTISSASPAVVSFSSPHGLQYHNPIQFSTTEQLPSPLLPDTTYYVLPGGITATSFTISDNRGGAAINTSGPQSGTHSVNMRRLTHGHAWTGDNDRGVSAGIVRVRGIWLNASPITNGPAALRGTYIGTTRSDPALSGGFATFTWKFGKLDATDPHGWHGVWNCYNRRPVASTARYGIASWAYNSAIAREINDSTTNRIYHIRGLDEDAVVAQHWQFSQGPANGTVQALVKITPPPLGGAFRPEGYRASLSNATPGFRNDNASWRGNPTIGWITIAAAEQSIDPVGSVTMAGNAAGVGQVQALELAFTA